MINRFINFFLNYLSKRWLWFCIILGLALFGIAFFDEYQRSLGRSYHTPVIKILKKVSPALLIPLTGYLCVILLMAAVVLEKFKDKVLFNLLSAPEIYAEEFSKKIELRKGERRIFESMSARLKIPDRFLFRIYFLTSDGGIYLFGGVRLKKTIRGLTHSEFSSRSACTYISFKDIQNIGTLNEAGKTLFIIILKNKKRMTVILPSTANFPKDIFLNRVV